MDEDAPSITIALIINIIIFIVIPLVMAYRRGYFFNVHERLSNLSRVFSKKKIIAPQEWTVIKIRPLSKFEKSQIRKIEVKFMPFNHDGYWARITLNSGKTMDYILGDRKNYWVDDELDKDKVLLRSWHKTGSQPYNDIVPIA